MRIKDLATRATKLLTGSAYMVFDNGTKVEKVDYAELAKQIITEYNTQTLAGSAQSVKSALDALNSNSVAKRGVLNSASIDLDDYTSPGVWLCTNVVTNIPERTYGELIVTASGPASQEVFQRFYTLQESPVCYIRQRNSNTWNPWVKLPTRAEVDTLNSKTVGYTIQAGASVEVDYSNYTSAVVVVSRAAAGSTPTVAVCDAWSGVTYVSNNTSYSVSVSGKKATITNNTTSACSYGVYMF